MTDGAPKGCAVIRYSVSGKPQFTIATIDGFDPAYLVPGSVQRRMEVAPAKAPSASTKIGCSRQRISNTRLTAARA